MTVNARRRPPSPGNDRRDELQDPITTSAAVLLEGSDRPLAGECRLRLSEATRQVNEKLDRYGGGTVQQRPELAPIEDEKSAVGRGGDGGDAWASIQQGELSKLVAGRQILLG
jgi:hypothetical protein